MILISTDMNAIADSSMISVFSSLGICWVLNRLFQQVFIAPSAESRFTLKNDFSSVETMTDLELSRALSLRHPSIWNESGSTEYTGYGLAADTAECYAIAEERGVAMLSDSDAARAYSEISGNICFLDRGDVLEQAAQRGFLEQNSAAQIYNVEIPQKLCRPLRQRNIAEETEIMRFRTNPPRQEWVSSSANVSLTVVPSHDDNVQSNTFDYSDL